jgi:hypothetical protein
MQTTNFNDIKVANNLDDMHKPSTPATSFIHSDDIIGELYRKKYGPSPFHH